MLIGAVRGDMMLTVVRRQFIVHTHVANGRLGQATFKVQGVSKEYRSLLKNVGAKRVVFLASSRDISESTLPSRYPFCLIQVPTCSDPGTRFLCSRYPACLFQVPGMFRPCWTMLRESVGRV